MLSSRKQMGKLIADKLILVDMVVKPVTCECGKSPISLSYTPKWECSEKCVTVLLQSNSWRPLGRKELLCKSKYL
jgi:hypothetical protein